MARLFISYNRREAEYAFAVRQWLMDEQGWASEDIFVDAAGLHSGVEWETKLLTEAENAEVMLFLASDHSLDIKSFCYSELQHAKGQIIAVTIGGVAFDDERINRALPNFAKARQVTALDQEPTQSYSYVSPVDGATGTVLLNADRLTGIGLTLRELGVAPNSYTWTPKEEGPFPGLKPLMEGDEAIFCGRDLEVRDGIKTPGGAAAQVHQARFDHSGSLRWGQIELPARGAVVALAAQSGVHTFGHHSCSQGGHGPWNGGW